ncbi:MAG: phosphopantetheine adenylyltransferase [Acidobacteria bacterium]|nr:MAG: phosphopantetheine adenylyltransferase [Acidobacteriota bacterium]REK03218.1 MAG: phosphopantetheine adenylyltransferase [Acidobacteriota bacterium]
MKPNLAHAVSILLALVGLLHLPPLIGALGADRLRALYAIEVQEPNLEILLRHRAVFFGLLGIFLVYAAVRPAAQPLALGVGLVSVLSFVVLAQLVGDYNQAIRRVVIADLVGAALLSAATVLHLVHRPGG